MIRIIKKFTLLWKIYKFLTAQELKGIPMTYELSVQYSPTDTDEYWDTKPKFLHAYNAMDKLYSDYPNELYTDAGVCVTRTIEVLFGYNIKDVSPRAKKVAVIW